MRRLALIPLAMLVGGCWTPGPGQIDPTRYPWDQPMLRQAQRPTHASYCIMTMETGATTGITVDARNTVTMACKEPPKQQP